MEELRAAAKVHYRDNSIFKKAIQAINERVDSQFDNWVDYRTFVTLVEERSRRCTSEALFRQLDRGGKRHLDQDDIRMLYYLMDTRGDCSHCKSPNNPTFNVCTACYRAKAFNHPHHNVFVDNYKLLQRRRFQQRNWEELRQSAVQGAATGLLVGATKEGYKESEAIAEQFNGLIGMAGEQAPEAGVSEAPGLLDPGFDSVQGAITETGNGLADTFTDIISFFLQ
ncbi:uncharacterized protein LOC115667742 [Syzygium oleosum]|uniref:uncharacterized protein LOC115667742 n=1 Tax=Syzygium oleosum TaxID=219896 RepID=UPI0024B88436|nr:uncharacterized protein LOC115667742 [Syzygium oleosum]